MSVLAIFLGAAWLLIAVCVVMTLYYAIDIWRIKREIKKIRADIARIQEESEQIMVEMYYPTVAFGVWEATDDANCWWLDLISGESTIPGHATQEEICEEILKEM